MNRGKYIVLEGAQGVGKTTQLQILAMRLQAAGLPVRTLREPDSQSDVTARKLRLLTQDPLYPMNTNTEVLLYNAARSQSLQVIKRSVEQGVYCLVDRNYLTTLAIQYYGRGDVPDYETINRIISFAVNGVEPDLCIVMDAPAQLLKERAQKRGQGERFDNLDEAFLERVRAGYLWEAKQRNLPVVFATEDEETIANTIWKHVTETLALRVPSKTSAATEPVSIKQVIEQRQQRIDSPSESKPKADSEYFQPASLTGKPLKTYRTQVDKLLQLRAAVVKHPGGDQAMAMLQPLAAMPEAERFYTTQLITSDTIDTPDASDAIATPSDQPVTLVDFWPRTEFSLLSKLSYSDSNQSYEQLGGQLNGWKYNQKAELLNMQLSKARKLAYYWFEITATLQTAVSLSTYEAITLMMQPLTPRFGYGDFELEGAAAEDYQACFDASLEAYSALQALDLHAEAQLVTLTGHKQRCLIGLNLDTIHTLATLADTPNLRALGEDLLAQVAETHPLFVESL